MNDTITQTLLPTTISNTCSSSSSTELASSPAPYPISTKTATSTISTVHTTATVLGFADKILVTIIQSGRLAQWFQVPLDAAHPALLEAKSNDDDDGLLPLTHLTPKCLLGVGTAERQAQGQLYAVQIASAVAMRNIRERRTVVVGLGLEMAEHDREVFFEILELVGRCL